MGFSLAVQTLIYDALSSDVTLSGLVAGVFDNVKQGQAFPYVTIGEATHSEWDTNETLGNDVSLNIHIWTRGGGRKASKEIAGAIFNALHRQTLTVAGYTVISIDFETETSFLDSDALTMHGVQTYRVLIDEI